ncbi:hypothetical protein EYF80_025211 [Liparis tanakae]|uniref:Uncharacterized protein n=1 Tax=Liparis tanakae TaxID=230148 RepID=A0A4Z2HI46_9TELE|nr:hypothetical protein EYF80_025211 [Liparis tanakae]
MNPVPAAKRSSSKSLSSTAVTGYGTPTPTPNPTHPDTLSPTGTLPVTGVTHRTPGAPLLFPPRSSNPPGLLPGFCLVATRAGDGAGSGSCRAIITAGRSFSTSPPACCSGGEVGLVWDENESKKLGGKERNYIADYTPDGNTGRPERF